MTTPNKVLVYGTATQGGLAREQKNEYPDHSFLAMSTIAPERQHPSIKAAFFATAEQVSGVDLGSFQRSNVEPILRRD